jgi:hypothetical protein
LNPAILQTEKSPLFLSVTIESNHSKYCPTHRGASLLVIWYLGDPEGAIAICQPRLTTASQANRSDSPRREEHRFFGLFNLPSSWIGRQERSGTDRAGGGSR